MEADRTEEGADPITAARRVRNWSVAIGLIVFILFAVGSCVSTFSDSYDAPKISAGGRIHLRGHAQITLTSNDLVSDPQGRGCSVRGPGGAAGVTTPRGSGTALGIARTLRTERSGDYRIDCGVAMTVSSNDYDIGADDAARQASSGARIGGLIAACCIVFGIGGEQVIRRQARRGARGSDAADPGSVD